MSDTTHRLMRDFNRYTGDGLPDEPVGHPLPIGDPASGAFVPSKEELREWAATIEVSAATAAGIHSAVYSTLAAGLADTEEDDYFSVPESEKYITLYQKNAAGLGDIVGQYPTRSFVDGRKSAAGTASTAAGAGYESYNPNYTEDAVMAARQGVVVEAGEVGAPITITKSATTGSGAFYGVYLKIPYNDISDLDKLFMLNAALVSGQSFDIIRILKNAADWNPVHAPLFPSLSDAQEGRAGFNIYDLIVSSDYQADYDAQDHLYVLLAETDENAANNDAKTGVWTVQPRFESSQDVIANKVTDSLRADILGEVPTSNNIGDIASFIASRKVAITATGTAKSASASTASIDTIHTYDFDDVGEVDTGYTATLFNDSGFTYSRSRIFTDYTTQAADKKYRVYVNSNGVSTTVQVRITNSTGWGSADGSVGQLQTTNVALNAANGYTAYVDVDYTQYASFYAAAGRIQQGFVLILYDGFITPAPITLSTYVFDITTLSQADNMANGFASILADVLDLPETDEVKSITAWGDSLTANGGWTSTLANLSGLTVYNGGTGGEKTTTIAARQGGDAMVVNNITIPGGTTPVVIADRDVDGGIATELGNTVTPLLQGGGGHFNPCTIADVEGTLAWTGSGSTDTTGDWTFTRSTAGDAVTIDRPTAIRTDFDKNRNGGIQIIFMGQNGGQTSNADLVLQHRRMIEHSTAEHTVVLGLSSQSAAFRANYEAAMREAFGRYFISLREYLATPIFDTDGTTIISCYGLDDAGLTPTAADLSAIATGTVPPQLFTDGVHYTGAARTVIGTMLYRKMRDLNLF